MSTPSAAGSRTSLTDQAAAALKAAGAVVVVRCAVCNDWHAGECPFKDAGPATPYVALIDVPQNDIQDGVLYDGTGKPQFVMDDDRGWREM